MTWCGDRSHGDAGDELDGVGEAVPGEDTDVRRLPPWGAGHVGEAHAVGADTGGDVGLLEPVPVGLGDVDRHVDGIVAGEHALTVGGLDEGLGIPHVVGMTVGEQDRSQGEAVGSKKGQGTASRPGTGSTTRAGSPGPAART